MDGFFEKFSIYDFFNLIGSGLVFLMGLVLMGVLPIFELMKSIPDAANWQWLLIIAVLGVCYLSGTFFQQISSLCFEKRYCNKLTSKILCENGTVIDNKLKLEIHQRKARELFKRKCLQFEAESFSEEQCNYYFAYCSYYIQNQNNHHKAEKMRGLRGMYSLLLTCFFFLIVVCAVQIAFCFIRSEEVEYFLYIFVSFVVLFALCTLMQGNDGRGAVQKPIFHEHRTFPNADRADRSAIQVLGSFDRFHSDRPSLSKFIAKLFQCAAGNFQDLPDAFHRDIMFPGDFPDIVTVITHPYHIHLIFRDMAGQIVKQ